MHNVHLMKLNSEKTLISSLVASCKFTRSSP